MRDKRFNILLIASWYPSKDYPTAGSFMQEQAHMLRDFGHHVTVIHPFMLGNFANSINKRSTVSLTHEDDIRVVRVGVAPPVPFFRGVSYEYCFLCVRKAMKSFQLEPHDFTIIHSHAMFMGGLIGYRLSKKYNLPQVHTEHTSGLIFNPKQYSKRDFSMTRRAYEHCHKVLFVSQFALERTLQNLSLEVRDTFQVLPNVVDTAFFSSSILSRAKATSWKFLVIGNFIPRKNHALLLEAFAFVQKQFPAVGLTIAGHGPLMVELQALSSSLQLKNITWLPGLSRIEVRKEIAAHHAILSTSTIETFGLTVAEAQAMGKPVVVTDSGGVRDILTPTTGIITDLSSESFAKGILQLIQSFDTYDQETIRQSTKRRFSSEVIMEQLHEIYDQALSSFH
jgi:glycosyltransferase involved in cell wall biosynthesis